MKNVIWLSAECDSRLAGHFEEKGYEVIKVRTSGIVSDPVSCHPDMFMCRMGTAPGSPVIHYRSGSGASLTPVYPGDIAYNAACTGKYFIHNLKHTAPELIRAAEASGMILTDVRQGYAKCSTVTVDEDSIITYDRGIARACESAGMNVLTVRPGHIILPGYDTGFIGGTSGRVGNTVCFNGDLLSHPDSKAMIAFIEGRALEVKWFPEWPLTDIGTIIEEG